MPNSPRLGAPQLAAAQALPESKVNEQQAFTEQGASRFVVVDRDVSNPAALTPAQGECYLVKAPGAGAWVGHDGDLAFYFNTGWKFVEVLEGFEIEVLDEDASFTQRGGAWTASGGSSVRAMSFQVVGTVPGPAEILALVPIIEALTIPANFSGSASSVITNPTASFVVDVQRQTLGAGAFASIGTITVSTGGVVTWATSGGTAKALAVTDVLKFVGDSDGDATFIGAFTVKATL